MRKNQIINWLLRDKYNGQETPALEKDLKRLKKGEPLDYVIGWKPFLNCRINLSLKPLIPRPETEFWVEKAIQEMKAAKDSSGKISVLDVFAGSGCAGVAVLKNIPNAQVDFAEKYASFLKQIKINCDLNKLDPKRYGIVKSDVFSKIKNRYDFILANPPYIAKNDKRVQKSVLAFEPKQALFGGEDGLFFIEEFLKEAREHLNPKGEIWLEFGAGQKTKLSRLLKKYEYRHFEFSKDQYNRWRFLVAIVG